jgi:hypothetical protein
MDNYFSQIIPEWLPQLAIIFALFMVVVWFGFIMGRAAGTKPMPIANKKQNPGPAALPETGDIFRDALRDDKDERIPTIRSPRLP